MRRLVLFCLFILLGVSGVRAQDSYGERAKKYIDQYRDLALQEQKASGIPASITLGQGILETEAGASELMTEANNHFGIKCNNGWSGPTFNHTDDRPNECFKKYSCAAESFRDHSLHLKRNPRYSPLFNLSQTDYAAWATCLKKCGYATSPTYAQQLIKIIEDYNLQQYTFAAMDSNAPAYTADKPILSAPAASKKPLLLKSDREEIPAPVSGNTVHNIEAKAEETGVVAEESNDDGKVVSVNGLRAFFAHKGEMLLSYAVIYNVRYPHLLEINDLPDGPLPFDMYVYLDKKLPSGTHDKHVVTSGESLLMIAQAESIQLKKLMAMNLLGANEEPASGAILELQKPASRKPSIMRKEASVNTTDNDAAITASFSDPRREENYIDIHKIKTASEPADEPSRPATKPPAAEIKSTPKTVNAPANKPVSVKPHVEKVKEPLVKTEEDEELAKLKADLDKVVYADNSKIPAAAKSQTATSKTPPETVKETESKAEKVHSRNPRYYVIRKGETAFSIAKRNNVTVEDLFKWNDIDARGIQAGRKIIVQN